MHHQETSCPYIIGDTIILRLQKPHDQSVAAKIIQLFKPFTLSCAMVVELDSPALGLQRHMALKLFDRRFAVQLRQDEKLDPWSPNIEQEYHQFIQNGGAEEFIQSLNLDASGSSEEETWTAAENEAYLHDRMREMYKTEVEVYDTLKDIQGNDIPRLLARVTLSEPSSLNSEYADVPGILMDYVDGFPLTNVAEHAPRETWQGLCDEAIRIVNVVGERGMLNKDVKTRSFIVHPDETGSLKVSMIDFALCKFRREYEDKENWRLSKSNQDEEGAVGYLMQKYLKGGFVYHRSDAYNKLDEEFKMEG